MGSVLSSARSVDSDIEIGFGLKNVKNIVKNTMLVRLKFQVIL